MDVRIILFRIFKAQIGRTKIKSCQIAATKISRESYDKKGGCNEKKNLKCLQPSLHSTPASRFLT
jgi:hypothetical protein